MGISLELNKRKLENHKQFNNIEFTKKEVVHEKTNDEGINYIKFDNLKIKIGKVEVEGDKLRFFLMRDNEYEITFFNEGKDNEKTNTIKYASGKELLQNLSSNITKN